MHCQHLSLDIGILPAVCHLFVPVWISPMHVDSSGFLKTLHSFRSLPVSVRLDTFTLFDRSSTATSSDLFSPGSSVMGLTCFFLRGLSGFFPFNLIFCLKAYSVIVNKRRISSFPSPSLSVPFFA